MGLLFTPDFTLTVATRRSCGRKTEKQNMFGASSELASVMEFGLYRTEILLHAVFTLGRFSCSKHIFKIPHLRKCSTH